ncbi:FAS1-like dehydratase domain-containing protein [Mycolicibacterium hodleri]
MSAFSPKNAQPLSLLAMALSPDIVGMTYTYPEPYVVGREVVRQYANAVKNEDAAYVDEDAARALGHDAILAPLTFISILGLRAQMAFFEHANIPIFDEKLIQAEQGLKLLQPIKAGDTLYCHIRIDSLRQAFGADVLTLRSRITNQHGETVQEDYTTMAGRSEADGTA